MLGICLTLVSCSDPGRKEIEKAKKSENLGQYSEAAEHYQRAILRSDQKQLSLEAAREAARLNFYQIKDFNKALEFYRYIVIHSDSKDERLSSQKQIATIYFDHLTNYENAVLEISKLLNMQPGTSLQREFGIKLARAYFYQNNFIQAESEVNQILNSNPTMDEKFEMMVFKGNIYLAKKDIVKASLIFKQAIDLNPEKATKENVALTLAVAYEEMKDYKSAIETLTAMKAYHPMPEYLEIRIKRLAERKKNLPGARGIRK